LRAAFTAIVSVGCMVDLYAARQWSKHASVKSEKYAKHLL